MTSYTIPYHLRPHKAIERNLFIHLLWRINGCGNIKISDYRYLGFGGPSLEDFKLMHLEFDIRDMHCLENNDFARSRQTFNNPYYFIKLFPDSSTEYITGPNFKNDKNYLIWLDYAAPRELRQQLKDIEFLGQKTEASDIVKFTFNANPKAFHWTHRIKMKDSMPDYKKILAYMKEDPTYQLYNPDHFTVADIFDDFSILLRAMAIRAVQRGLKERDDELKFHHLCSFTYADGQAMTTMTGIICKQEAFDMIIKESDLANWQFYQKNSPNEIIKANEIHVPSMTVLERMTLDKLIPSEDIAQLAASLQFNYGSTSDEHKRLIEGYCRYYPFFPYYSKVIY